MRTANSPEIWFAATLGHQRRRSAVMPPGGGRDESGMATQRHEARAGRGLRFCAARRSRTGKGSHTSAATLEDHPCVAAAWRGYRTFAMNLISISRVGSSSRGVSRIVLTASGPPQDHSPNLGWALDADSPAAPFTITLPRLFRFVPEAPILRSKIRT